MTHTNSRSASFTRALLVIAAILVTSLGSPENSNAYTTTFPGMPDIYLVNPGGNHQAWATFRRGPQSFAIGNAADGWRFDVGSASGGYAYGYLEAPDNHIQKCAWIDMSNLEGTGSGTTPSCSLSSTVLPFAVTDFASYVNCTACSDAYRVTIRDTAECTDHWFYANVKPWRSSTSPTDPVLSFVPGTTKFDWRYITKDGNWVMGRVPFNPDGTLRHDGSGAWLFVQRGCLPQVIGYPATSWTGGNL